MASGNHPCTYVAHEVSYRKFLAICLASGNFLIHAHLNVGRGQCKMSCLRLFLFDGVKQ